MEISRNSRSRPKQAIKTARLVFGGDGIINVWRDHTLPTCQKGCDQDCILSIPQATKTVLD